MPECQPQFSRLRDIFTLFYSVTRQEAGFLAVLHACMQEDKEENDLIAIRRNKIEALKSLDVNPFGGQFDCTGSISATLEAFTEGETVRIAGRITAHRDMGKSHFLDLSYIHGRMQVFVSSKNLSEADLEAFKLLDLGDFLGVEGECFTTKTGEPSVKVKSLTVLSKALRPLPAKWHGLSDVETRYRQRYLDLIANPHSSAVFLKRIEIVRSIRRFLEERGFLEVETPMMQSVAGGAAARPFKTHHNSLGQDLYLRIAPELYLKRLLVGGFDKVFELNRNFRNEGISRRHNPEFTMLELYQAYGSFETMAELIEEMICSLAMQVCGSLVIEHKNADGEVTKTIDLTRPWKRARFQDLITEIQPDWFSLTTEQKRARCEELGMLIHPHLEDFEITQQLFEKKIEEVSINPLFVTHVPTELVPLANQNKENPATVDVYELVINGQEISPGYSELNDPIIQRERLTDQVGEEIQDLDEDFITALEYGMPPAGGLGLGIDRLVMMLTGAESIRDVILFPHLKRK